MRCQEPICNRAIMLVALVATLIFASTRLRADTQTTGTCSGSSVTIPFTDVPSSSIFFCSIAAAYFSGLTNGTSATTYSPAANVPREQMAAFVSRTLDQSLRRGSRRAALKHFWDPKSSDDVPKTVVPNFPTAVECDGADLWVANFGDDSVSRVRASDGRLLETWTGIPNPTSLLVARGRIYVTSEGGSLFAINPAMPAGAATHIVSGFITSPHTTSAMAFDGNSIWIGQTGPRLSRVTFNSFCTPCVTHINTGFSSTGGIVYDGANIWVTDGIQDTVKKVNSIGEVIFTVPAGDGPDDPVFDGMNIWVPNLLDDSITVVRVKDSAGNPLSTPFVLATLTGNRLNRPTSAAFDGERILVANNLGNSVSLWRAIDLAPLGSVSLDIGSEPGGVCSDGLNFWITLPGTDRLARF